MAGFDFHGLLSQGEAFLAFCLALIAVLGVLGRWFWGRINSHVTAGVSDLTAGHRNIESRLEHVEEVVGGVRADLEKVRARTSTIEGRIDQLATSREVHALAVSVAKISAGQEAQNNMIRILYEAAQRATKEGG